MDQEKIQAHREQVEAENEKRQNKLLDVTLSKGVRKQVELGGEQTKDALVAAVKVITRAIRENEPAVTVKNQPTFPTSVNTPDITAVVKALKPIAESVSKLPTKYPDFPKFPKFPDFPKDLTVKNLQEIKPWLEAITKKLGELKLDPKISVAPTPVTIPPIDFKPLIEALKPQEKTLVEVIDLNNFKAQDLTGDDTFQYVGFVAPNGNWYIIENDIEGNSLRYSFGVKNYSAAWKKFNGHSYKLLNEAIREIQA